MKKIMILTVLVMSLVIGATKVYALDAKKFGPVLDGEGQSSHPQFNHI